MLGSEVYDVVGVGIGPFNLGLAALLEEKTNQKTLFLDKKSEFLWHPGMLIEGTVLQVSFLADLVSLVDPCSSYSFLNYLKEHERLYSFYFLEDFHIPRQEYSDYCRWASRRLGSCQFGADVESVTLDDDGLFSVTYCKDGQTIKVRSKNVVMGVGSKPALPACAEPFREEASVLHSADYLTGKAALVDIAKVAIVGSGQSAGEIFLDILQERPEANISWLTRSKGFFPMEYSKLGLEYFSPDYIDFFHKLPTAEKINSVESQDLLYKGISATTIADIYDLLYHRTVGGKSSGANLYSQAEVVEVEKNDERSAFQWRVALRHKQNATMHVLECDALVFATGYESALPKLLDSFSGFSSQTHIKELAIDRQYRLELEQACQGALYIQNGDLFTHGVGAPDLGLGVHRNSVIINTICEQEILKVDKFNVFQRFEMPERF